MVPQSLNEPIQNALTNSHREIAISVGHWTLADNQFAQPLGMRLIVDRPPYQLSDFGTFFDELLCGLRLDLVARARKFDVDLSQRSAR
jgi:hypothetical protein